MDDIEMDYDNVYLNEHIEAVKPETFKIYLNILLSFMNSDNSKICFPDIAGPLKVLFIEITQDVRALTSRCIDKTCLPLCSEIIHVMEENRNVFKLYCEEGSSSRSGLVLKKNILYGNISYQTNTGLIHPEALSMEALNKKLDRLNNQSSITTGFKLQCLNTALKFIKDNTQLIKEYPDLTAPQAELITTLICNPNVNSDIGFGFKSFYAPLWEALKIFGLKYEFKIREKDSGGGKKCLILEKIAKNAKMDNRNNVKPTPMDTSESDVSFRSDTSTKKKKIRKSDTTLKSLTTQFVRTTLDKITDFYNDDAMASLTFKGLNHNEHFFLNNFKNVMASNRMKAVFEKSVRISIENIIGLAKSKDHYKLSIKKTKMCDGSNRAITFTKVPVFKKHGSWVDVMDKKENTPFNSSSDRSISRERGHIKISVNAKNKSVKDDTDSSAGGAKSVNSPTVHVSRAPPRYTRRSLLINSVLDSEIPTKDVNGTQPPSNIKGNTDLVEKNIASVDNPKEHTARERNKSVILPLKSNMAVNNSRNKSRDTKTRCDQSTDRSISKDRRASGICFQPGGVLDPHRPESAIDKPINNTIDKQESHRERPRSGADLNIRKVKLLEAMSVPIQSDKGLRMMRGMGWEGGALGLRGEGIMEPLIPALDRVSWAGLGHVAPPKPVKLKTVPRKPADFRLGLLRAVLRLLDSDLDQSSIIYQPGLSKKERNFFKQAIQCFSTRSRIELADEEMDLCNRIQQLLKDNPELMVRGCVTPCKGQIQLSKVCQRSMPNVNINASNELILGRMTKIEDKLKRALKIDVSDMLATLEQDCQSKKSYDLLEFKIDILINMLEFFKVEELKMTWCSRENLNKKKIHYIDYAMESIDLGARFGSTEPEIALVKEILRLAGEIGVEYEFFNQYRSFTVTKVRRAKKYSNKFNNNNHDSINKNKINKNEVNIPKNTDKTVKSDIDNTDSMGLNSQSETTEEPVSSSDDVIIIEGKESPIMISDDERYLLGSPLSDWDYEPDKTSDNETEKTKDFESKKTTVSETDKTDNDVEKTREYGAEMTTDYGVDKSVVYETEKTEDFETYEVGKSDYEVKKTMDYVPEKSTVYETGKDMPMLETGNCSDIESEETMVYEAGKTTDETETATYYMIENTEVYDTEQTIEYETEKSVPDLEVSENCDNFDCELKELEEAIKDADDIKHETSPLYKRVRSDSPNSDEQMSKLTKLEIKKVCIVHSNHPIDRLTKVNIQNLQEVISCEIFKWTNLPLLKCHGVQEGALVYSCHNEHSYEWLKNTISVASDVKILETKGVEEGYKMSLKFNCYFDCDVDYLFEMLELYNKDLSTSKWMVLKHHIFLDHVCFVVKMDIRSYYYVRNSGYSLFAGVDEVQFSIIWD